MQLIDSHCHLDFSIFESDLAEVITNANINGVGQFVIPGIDCSQWQGLITFCQNNPNCHYALGIHPYFLNTYQPQDLEQLAELINKTNAIAVGECGIDSAVDNLPLQQQIFAAQVELANQYHKPLIIHHRKSHHLILQTFKTVKPLYGGVIHAFSGSIQDANKYLELGFKLGVGGTITYPRASKTREVIKQLPLEALLLETDSPDMPINGKQGERNEPKYLPLILQQLAQIKGLSPEKVAQQLTFNTQSLFKI